MRKFIFATALLCSIFSFAQDYPGKNIEVLNSKELKVMSGDPTRKEFGYYNFFSDEKLQKIYKKKGVSTKAEAVEGKTFKLLSYKPDGSSYIMKLDNPDTGVIYYKYETDSPYRFYFEVVGGLEVPDDIFCDQLVGKKEWSSRETKHVYNYKTASLDDMQMTGSGKAIIMSSLITAKSDVKETIKGVTYILDNNEKVEFPDVTIDVRPSTNGRYDYNAVFSPEQKDIEKFMKNKIVKVQMGSHIRDIYSGGLFMRYVRCLNTNK